MVPRNISPTGKPAHALRRHVSETLRLALPVIAARVGFVLFQMVDTIMTGRMGAQELAFLGLANGMQMLLMLVGLGFLRGVPILVAHSQGAGQTARTGAIWRMGQAHGLGLGLLLMVIGFASEPIFLLVGLDPALAAGGGGVMIMFSLGLPFLILWVATSSFLEGLGRPLPGMFIMAAGGVANVGLNWVFVFGHLGAPAMGAEGAMLATSILRVAMYAAFVVFIYTDSALAAHGVRGSFLGFWARGKQLRQLGFPLGLVAGIETGSYAVLTMFAGFLGVAPLAAFQIGNTLIAFIFMVALGLGAATAVRVGHEVGRGDMEGVRFAGWIGLGVVTAIMATLTLVVLAVPDLIAMLFTDDAEVLGITRGVIMVAGALLVMHGAQGTIIGALRGAGDFWIPTFVQLVSFWVIMAPAGALFAFELEWGAAGLMAGIMTGLSAASLALTLRFWVVSRRTIAHL